MGRTRISLKILPTEYDAFFKLIGSDPEFPPTYDGWLKSTTDENTKCRSRGDIIKEVEVHPNEFAVWRGGALHDPSLASLYAFAIAKSRGN